MVRALYYQWWIHLFVVSLPSGSSLNVNKHLCIHGDKVVSIGVTSHSKKVLGLIPAWSGVCTQEDSLKKIFMCLS